MTASLAAMSRFTTVVDALVARSASAAPAYLFLADGTAASEARWSYAVTFQRATECAAHLARHGIRPGDRVIVAVSPGLEFIGVLFGIMLFGAVPVPCVPPLRAKDSARLDAIALDCAPAAIVVDESFRDAAEALGRRFNAEVFAPTDFVSGAAPTVSPAPSDLALLQYTSGSTGTPKGVCLSHDNLVSNCQALGRSMGHDPRRVGCSWLPPYHDMGLLGTIILSMYQGWPLALMSPLHFVQEPLRWLHAITHYRVTTTVGPNFALDLCADAVDRADAQDTAGLDLSNVTEWYCGAEPIRDETLTRFEKTMATMGFDARALIPCYGMAEATLFVSGKRRGARHRVVHRHEFDRAVVSCGEVDGEHVVRIVDPATLTRCADGAEGEIWVSGRNVAQGYYPHTAECHAAFAARLAGDDTEYLRTGDLGFLSSGELFVTGRLKDLIIVNGRNIHPHDVEAAAVSADPAVRAAVAFGVERERVEHLCVVVEARRNGDDAILTQTVRARVTAEFGVTVDVRVCAQRTIPTTTSGKVRRQEARRMFLAGELRSRADHLTGAT